MQDPRTRADRDEEYKELARRAQKIGPTRNAYEQLLAEQVAAALDQHDDANDADDDPSAREAAARASATLIALATYRSTYNPIEAMIRRLHQFGAPRDLAEQLIMAQIEGELYNAEHAGNSAAGHRADAYLIALAHIRFAAKQEEAKKGSTHNAA